MQPIKISYFGSKPLGERCLRYLLEDHKDLDVGLICSNQSANNWWKSNGLFELAQKHKISFVDNSRRHEDELLKAIQENHCNYLICVQHPWIISDRILSHVQHSYNFHNAKLPEYKGHNCCNHAILNGDKTYTTTVHVLTLDVDAGDIVLENEIEISETETAKSLYDRSNEEAFQLFKKLIESIKQSKPFKYKKQDGSGTFYPRNSLEKYKDLSGVEDLKFISMVKRALHFPPFEGPFVLRDGKKEFLA